jgi:hypothetical protein
VTATYRALALPAAIALTLIAAGCGAVSGRSEAAAPVKAPFAWLRPQPPPAGWRLARTPAGATLPYPAGWRLVAGDLGTVTAALRDAHGRYLGYLNLTPRQGAERQAGWASFRVRHNEAEGNRDDRVLAARGGLRFSTGRGACVQDSYVTSSGVSYMEIACLIDGRRPSVVVGAAPPAAWRAQAGAIERAIDAARV